MIKILGFSLASSTLVFTTLKSLRLNSQLFSRKLSSMFQVDDVNIIKQIYSQVHPRNLFSVTVTGGGVQLIENLFVVPGASRCLMKGEIPYSKSALAEILEKDVVQACSVETARDMAEFSYRRTVELLLKDVECIDEVANANILGIAVTAALSTNVIKKGDHRCHIAVTEKKGTTVYTIILVKGKNTRVEEDLICSRLSLYALVNSCMGSNLESLKRKIEDISEDGIESISVHRFIRSPSFDNIYSGKSRLALLLFQNNNNNDNDHNSFYSNTSISTNEDLNDHCNEFQYYEDVRLPPTTIVYSGSFNPLHEGHVALVAAAVKHLGYDGEKSPTITANVVAYLPTESAVTINQPSEAISTRTHATTAPVTSQESNRKPLILFELSPINADKPPLSKEELMNRIRQFSRLTNPLFEKFGILNFGVCVTNEPLFLKKSELFRHCIFVLGADTFTRLINPKYYLNSEYEMIVALSRINERGLKFIVGGRKVTSSSTSTSTSSLASDTKIPNEFETLADIISSKGNHLPSTLKDMFVGLNENEFRMDISSTEIRRKRSGSSS